MTGERGGTVHSLDQATELQETYKRRWTAKIRWRMAEVLVATGKFHAEDLLPLNIPAEHKNCVGAQVNAAVTKKLMRETGERRSCATAQGHGRRSAVYEVTAYGRQVLTEKLAETSVEEGSNKAEESSVGVNTGPPAEPLQLDLTVPDVPRDPASNRFMDLDQQDAA